MADLSHPPAEGAEVPVANVSPGCTLLMYIRVYMRCLAALRSRVACAPLVFVALAPVLVPIPVRDRGPTTAAEMASDVATATAAATDDGGDMASDVATATVTVDGASDVAMATVALGVFELSCPSEMAEGQTYQCSVHNTGDEEAGWPTVGLMHSSSDAEPARVAGSPLDAGLGAPVASSEIVSSNWWIGSELIGYQRFDWSGDATADQTQQFAVVVADDVDHEPAETFYIGLIASGSKNMTAMFASRQAISIAASDSANTDASMSEIGLSAGSVEYPWSQSDGVSTCTIEKCVSTNAVEVGYDVTELVITPEPLDVGATVSVDGVQLEPTDVGEPGVVRALAVGATTVPIVVTAPDGTTAHYALEITRSARADGSAAEVSADGFTLSCPFTIWEGLQHVCSLTNTGNAAKAWPLVAVMHSGLDAQRAQVTADSLVGHNDAGYSRDVRMWPEVADAEDGWNFGYGELFPGDIVSTRVVYGYQQVDLAGEADAGEQRWIRLAAGVNTDLASPELFYIAMAADGQSGIDKLVTNRVPVLVADASSSAPATGSIEVDEISSRSARVSVTLERPGQGQLAVFARWRPAGSGAEWVTVAARSANGGAVLDLTGLTVDTDYTFESSLDQAFPEASIAAAVVSTLESLFQSATVSGSSLTLAYGSALDESSRPVAGDFSVEVVDAATGTRSTPAVTAVAMTAATVVLTLGEAVRFGDTVAVNYTAGTNPIRDLNGNDASNLANAPVVNATPESSDAALSELSLGDGVVLSPSFEAGVLAYAATVANAVSEATVTATAKEGRATVSVEPADASGAPGDQVALAVGVTDVTATVTAEDGAVRRYTVTVTREVNVAPAFGAGSVSRRLAENSGAGVPVGAPVTAGDDDAGQALSYSLEGPDASLFVVDAASGQISTVAGAGYDFESATEYSLVVRATDDGSPSLFATADVTVELTDVAEVPSIPVPRVRAATRDSITVEWDRSDALGGPPVSGYDVQYRIKGSSGGWDSGPQDVAGTVAVVSALRVRTEYEVQVRATNEDGDSEWSEPVDHTTPESSDAALSELSLGDGVVLSPSFEAGVLAYAATVANAVSEATVTATAKEGRATVSVEPADASGAPGDQVALAVGVTDVTATVTAEDGAVRRYTVTVTREVNVAPAFGAGSVSRRLAENSGAGVPVGAPVTAGDDDAGQALSYSLEGPDASLFVVDAASGQISTVAGAGYDFESATEYSLVVRATDDGSPSLFATADVTVELTDVAEVPSIPVPRVRAATRDSITVEWDRSDALGGPPVSGYDVQYRIKGSSGGWDSGPQDVAGTVAVVSALRVRTEYEVQVRATNEDGDSEWSEPVDHTTPESSDAALSELSLGDGVVLSPSFEAGVLAYAATVANAVSEATVTATAKEGRATVSVEPADASGAPGDQVALAVGVTDVTATVTAEDGAVRRYTVTVTREVNVAPAFGAGSVSRRLAENSGAGVPVGAPVTAGDDDAGQALSYSLEGPDASLFVVDAASGQISTVAGAGYDFESATEYSLVVRATDDGSPSLFATADVTVELTDVAEVPSIPVPRVRAATRDSITVEWDRSDALGGPPVSGYDVQYRIKGSSGGWDSGPQDVAGTVAVVSALRVRTEYEVQVRATNEDGDSEWSEPVDHTTPESSDAALSELSLGDGVVLSPSFEAGVLAYAATVANAVSEATVTATAKEGRATVSVEPADASGAPGDQVALAVGATDVTATVTAEDGAVRRYTVTVTRLPETVAPTLVSAAVDGAELRLTYDEALDETSTPPTAAFRLRVTDSATSEAYEAEVTEVSVGGDAVTLTLGGPVRHRDVAVLDYSPPLAGPVRDLAANGAAALSGVSVSNTTAAASDAALRSLELSDVVTDQEFSASTLEYTSAVVGLVSATTVAATAADSRAEVSITPVDSEPAAGHQVDLVPGPNVIEVIVAAEDESTIRYTVAVTRLHETKPPGLVSAAAVRSALELTYGELLDDGSVPPPSAFVVRLVDAVTLAPRSVPVSRVAVSGAEVRLTLVAAVRRGDTVEVGYAAPRAMALRDTSGNPAAGLESVPVRNDTAAAADASLSALALTQVTLAPPFSPDTTRYLADVTYRSEQTTVRAEAADSRSVVEMLERLDSDPGAEGHQAALVVGRSVIAVRVTAEDGRTSQVYEAVLDRAAPHLPPPPDPPEQPPPPALAAAAARHTSGSRQARADAPRAATGQHAAASEAAARTARTARAPAVSSVTADSTASAGAALTVTVELADAKPFDVFVRYRPSATTGSGGWIAQRFTADPGEQTGQTPASLELAAPLFGLDPSTEHSVQAATDARFTDPATASLTTAAAAVITHTQQEFTLAPRLFMHGRDDTDGLEPAAVAAYDPQNQPSGQGRHFGMVRPTMSNVDQADLRFAVERQPEASDYEFCWRPQTNRISAEVCGDVLIAVRPTSGWLHIMADASKAGRTAFRAVPYLYDWPAQRATVSATDNGSLLKVYRDIIVGPPATVVDCSDYPGYTRERFNCLLNGEILPPAPSESNPADLLDDSLKLIYAEDEYELVFREEFDSDSTNSNCENFKALRPSAWSYELYDCGIADVNGNYCESIADGAYILSESVLCGLRGLHTGGRVAFKYGYIETKFTVRMHDYEKYTNVNFVLGSSRADRKYWLDRYNVVIDSDEDLFTNLSQELDYFECVDTNGYCIWHQYVNVGNHTLQEPRYIQNVESRSTYAAVSFCYGTVGHRIGNEPYCFEHTPDYDFEVTVTVGLEWTPRGYRRHYRVEGYSNDTFNVVREDRTIVRRYTSRGASYGIYNFSEKAQYFEHLDALDLDSVLEQVGVQHVPLHFEIGAWSQGMTSEQDTNEVKLAIDYIRIFQPEDNYADMEPVYTP